MPGRNHPWQVSPVCVSGLRHFVRITSGAAHSEDSRMTSCRYPRRVLTAPEGGKQVKESDHWGVFSVARWMSPLGPSRTSGEVRVESAKRGIADIASGLRPNRFMSTRPLAPRFGEDLKFSL